MSQISATEIGSTTRRSSLLRFRVASFLGSERTARGVLVVACAAASVWVLGYMWLRAMQPFPLDAFEEYQLHKAVRWLEGVPLYGAPEREVHPEAYPPLYFWLLGGWSHVFGVSIVAQRALSLLAFAGMAGCGAWGLRDSADRRLAWLVFGATILSFHALAAKFYEVGKPDTLLGFFLALAIVTGEHRSWPEAVVSSAALWLACLTKQNAALFVVPLSIAHAANGRFRWAVGWGGAMVFAIVATYALLDVSCDGNFVRWAFRWTAGHGVDFVGGINRTLGTVATRGPILLAAVGGAIVLRPRCRWTWSLATALAVGVMGMSKVGGIGNHLLPASFFGAMIIARALVGGAGQPRPRDPQASDVVRVPSLTLRFGSSSERSTLFGGVPCGILRWLTVAVLVVVVGPGLPHRREFRWLNQRAEELAEWTAAVRRLDGRVAVSHHWLLAREAGAECFFSDLIMEFPGLVVPASTRERISSRAFDYIILETDPQKCPTPDWAQIIDENYAPVGDLDFRNRSALLPRRVYKARPVTSYNDARRETVEFQ